MIPPIAINVTFHLSPKLEAFLALVAATLIPASPPSRAAEPNPPQREAPAVQSDPPGVAVPTVVAGVGGDQTPPAPAEPAAQVAGVDWAEAWNQWGTSRGAVAVAPVLPKAKPARVSKSAPGRQKNAAGAVMTEARCALLHVEWPAGINVRGVQARFNALPGPKVSTGRIGTEAAQLGLKRPKGFLPRHAPMEILAPVPPATRHQPIAIASKAARLPEPGPDGKIAVDFATAKALAAELEMEFDGTQIPALNKLRKGQPPIVLLG